VIFSRNLAISAVAGALLSGCVDIDSVPLVQPGTQTGQVVFVNTTSHPVIGLQFNPCDRRIFGGPDYGDDRMAGGRIAPGASRQFTVSAGCYHLRAMTGGGGLFSMNNVEDFQHFFVTAGQSTTVRVRRGF